MKSQKRPNNNVLLFAPFAITIFLGAFLLFQVQPIIGKYILPWFGGSSSVWTTALVFFQVILLLGYFYTYLISRYKVLAQVVVQAALLIFSSSLLYLLFSKWSSPITPGRQWLLNTTSSPSLRVLALLTISVGLPYFILSTTSVLLQKWFHFKWKRKSPYFLYSFSNTGSLLGLITYPILTEPILTLKDQGIWWSIAFIIYTVVFAICCVQSSRLPQHKKEKYTNDAKLKTFRITFLAALSSLMLVATTNQITQSVAATQFIWLLPLTLYLLSFIICFSEKKWYWPNIYAYVFLFFAFLIIAAHMPPILLPLAVGLTVYTGFLFSAFMILHGELYNLKPHPQHLNLFYLLIASGSAVGGFFAAILAPYLFPGFWEFFIGIFFTCFIAMVILIHDENSRFFNWAIPRFFTSKRQFYLFFIIFLSSLFVILPFFNAVTSGSTTVFKARNFYGQVQVVKRKSNYGLVSQLINGKIVHGRQYESKNLKKRPISYYSVKSGVGQAFLKYRQYLDDHNNKKLKIGVIGLGAGILAAYGCQGDNIRFYEINPQVEQIARNYFTYLKDSAATIDVVIDDARLALEKEATENKSQKYDILVVDAFSDDAIPIHLLTKEAFEIYLKRLMYPSGVLAVHISNSYLDLYPVVKKVAQHFGLKYVYITTKKEEPLTDDSLWMVLTHDESLLKQNEFIESKSTPATSNKNIQLWTDDYSNIIQILKLN